MMSEQAERAVPVEIEGEAALCSVDDADPAVKPCVIGPDGEHQWGRVGDQKYFSCAHCNLVAPFGLIHEEEHPTAEVESPRDPDGCPHSVTGYHQWKPESGYLVCSMCNAHVPSVQVSTVTYQLKAKDEVAAPPHYTGGNLDSIDAIREALGMAGFMAYCLGTVMKYSRRAGSKGDRKAALVDAQKAAWYGEWLKGKDPRVSEGGSEQGVRGEN